MDLAENLKGAYGDSIHVERIVAQSIFPGGAYSKPKSFSLEQFEMIIADVRTNCDICRNDGIASHLSNCNENNHKELTEASSSLIEDRKDTRFIK